MIYQQTNEGFKNTVKNLSMKVGYIKQVVKDQIVIIGTQQSWHYEHQSFVLASDEVFIIFLGTAIIIWLLSVC